MRSWSISKNSRIRRIKRIRTPHVNIMTLFVQAPHEEELEEFFTLP